MRVGLEILQDGAGYEEVRAIALEAESAGFDSLWVLDHLHAFPRPDDEQLLECWTVLSALAAETTRIRLGTLVLNMNNRNPALLAKMATTLDAISNGRLEFGIGAGGTNRAKTQKDLGYEYEFDAYGMSFPLQPSVRIEKLDEGLEIIKRMWTQARASFTGRHYSVRNAICLPRPVQKPYPPIWIGGGRGPKILKVVAKHADGWNMMSVKTIEEYRQCVGLLAAACREAGRNPHEVRTSLVIEGTIEECERRLRESEEAGLSLAIVRAPRGRLREYLRRLRRP